MNKQEPISPQQMGALFFAFMTGSSIINIPSPLIGKAGNGAWLSLLILAESVLGMLGCILLFASAVSGFDLCAIQPQADRSMADRNPCRVSAIFNAAYADGDRAGYRSVYEKRDAERNTDVCFQFLDLYGSGLERSRRD